MIAGIIALLAALIYLPMARQSPGLIRSLVKTVAVASLAVGALAAGPLLLASALAACALGDWLLSRDGDGAFVRGVAAFAVGHVFYIALFLTYPGSDLSRLIEWPRTLLALVLLGFGVTVGRALARHAGDLRGPVLAYVPVILLMGLAALTLPGAGVVGAAIPAAMAFMLSDAMIAAEKFLVAAPGARTPLLPFAIWVFYWLAQGLFYLAFVQGF